MTKKIGTWVKGARVARVHYQRVEAAGNAGRIVSEGIVTARDPVRRRNERAVNVRWDDGVTRSAWVRDLRLE